MKKINEPTKQPAGNVSRRTAIKTGITAAGAAAISLPSRAFPAESADEELTPFLDMPRTGPNRLDWETLDSWLTPQDQVFNVQHYGMPEIDEKNFKLEIDGLVKKPVVFTPAQLRDLPSKEQYMTLECSGNGASKGFINAIYNSKWTGTPLRPILEQCGIDPKAKEIVFIGADTKEETLRAKTRRELKIEVPFGRSMSMEDAMGQDLLLAYERNGKPIAHRNGAPIRLIVPGWYGIANVKWLTRIEVRDRRYMGRYMGRDYVTVRGERRGSEIMHVETSVGRMNLKSIIARITRRPTANGRVPLKAYGAAWGDGTEIQQVEVRVDDGKWLPAKLDAEPHKKFCWRFFSIDLGSVEPGKHTAVSRAIDVNDRVQPAAEDDEIALKKTYWEAYQQWPREIEVEA